MPNFEADRDDGTAQTASLANTSRVVTSRHLGGSNFSFVDGHVKWLQSDHPPVTRPADGTNFTFAS